MTTISNKLNLEQAQREIVLLKDYSKALQVENATRNEERKVLQKQISRLTNLQKKKISTSKATTQSCQECQKSKIQITKLKKQIEKLEKDNGNKFNISNDWEKKYKELLLKHNEINYQNTQLKKDQGNKINIQGLQQKVRKLQAQNSNLTSKTFSLESQIKGLKYSITTKDNQVNELKSKSLGTSQRELELKDSVQGKDKQLSTLRQSCKNLATVEFQLRNAKSTIVLKESQIAKLKQSMNKNQQQIVKTYQLESQIRNMKYTITAKDSQIEMLKNKTKEISSNEFNKISSLESQIKNLKNQLVNKGTEISALKGQNNEIKNKMMGIESQKKQWENKHQSQQKINQQSKLQNIQQLSILNSQIQKLSIQIKQKNLYTIKIENDIKKLIKSDEQKNLQVIKLDSIVNGYVQKIGQLQLEFMKLEKNSLNSSKNGQMSITNNHLLTQQNKILNQKISDLQRRILILQQTNMSLRQQLKLSIQVRSKDASRTIIGKNVPVQNNPNHVQFQQQFLNTIKMLTIQNQGIKQMNNQLKSDNEYLQARLSSSQLKLQKFANPTTNATMTNFVDFNSKLISSMPPIQRSKAITKTYDKTNPNQRNSKQIKIQHAYTILDDNQRDPLTIKNKQQIIRDKRQNRNQVKSRDRKQRGPNQPKLSKDRSLKLIQMAEKQQKKYKAEQIKQQRNMVAGNVNSGNQHLNLSKGNPQLAREGSQLGNRPPQHRHSTTGRTSIQDDLQRKIDLLRQQNKGLRKHLYQVDS